MGSEMCIRDRSNWTPLPVTQSLLVIGQRVTPIALNLLQKDSFWTFKLVRLHITKFPEHLILVARTIRPYCNEQVATRRKETKIGARVRTVKLKAADSYAIFLLSLLMNPRAPQPHFSSLHDRRFMSQAGRTRYFCLLYTSPSPRDLSTSRMPSSA